MNQQPTDSMVAVLTFALVGLDPSPVRVEVRAPGPGAGFRLIGLPEAGAREARVRLRAALREVGVEIDDLDLTVHVTPPTKDPSFDLAIAIGVLAVLGRVPTSSLEGTAVLGELSLGGAIQRVRGVLPMLQGAAAHGIRRAIVPLGNAAEAAHVVGVDVRGADQLAGVVTHLAGGPTLARAVARPLDFERVRPDVDLAELRGQPVARRALEVAAAGAHNLLFIGPPGCGKTIAARCLPALLPPLGFAEALEVTAIHSVAGLVPASGLVTTRPFRAPHHTVSPVGLVGGGDPVRPGEVSLAHLGCLFLDELAEFRRGALEALRQPLEDGLITLRRPRAQATFPAKPLIIAASNPCPCGFHGEPSKRCDCSEKRVRDYRARLGGPLLDRLDLRIALRSPKMTDGTSETSAEVRERVLAARTAQAARQRRGEVAVPVNAALSPRELAAVAGLHAAPRTLTRDLSAPARNRVLRVARTIADLDGSMAVKRAHVEEAVQLTTSLDPACSASASGLLPTHARETSPEAQGPHGGRQGRAPPRKSGSKESPG